MKNKHKLLLHFWRCSGGQREIYNYNELQKNQWETPEEIEETLTWWEKERTFQHWAESVSRFEWEREEKKRPQPYHCSLVQFSHSIFVSHELQHARPSCPSPTPGIYSNSYPSNRWCHPAISSSVVPFSSCSQSLQASGSFPMSQLFAWGGQSIGVSAIASVLPKNTQDWSPLERFVFRRRLGKTRTNFLANPILALLLSWDFFFTSSTSQDPTHIHLSKMHSDVISSWNLMEQGRMS